MPNCEIHFQIFSETIYTNLKIFSQHGLRKCRDRLLSKKKKKKKKKKDVRNFGQNFYLGCLSAFIGVFRSIKIKTHMNFYSELTSMVDAFSGCNNVQSAMG